MLKYHPDTNRSPDATQRAALINSAFSVLGNPKKRAAYDAARAAQSETPRSANQSPPPPPPPSSTPPKSDGRVAPLAKARQWSRTDLLVGGLGVLALGAVIFSGNESAGSSAIADESDMTLMNSSSPLEGNILLDAENDLAIDTNSDSTMNMDNLSELSLSQGSSTPSSTLSQPPTSTRFEVIEGAAEDFVRAFTMGGMATARSYSLVCHKKAREGVSWENTDNCAAFDYAAAYVDASFSRKLDTTPMPYFSFQRSNQADYYTELGATFYVIPTRLTTIRQTAEAAVFVALDAAYARQQAREPKQSEISPTISEDLPPDPSRPEHPQLNERSDQ